MREAYTTILHVEMFCQHSQEFMDIDRSDILSNGIDLDQGHGGDEGLPLRQYPAVTLTLGQSLTSDLPTPSMTLLVGPDRWHLSPK